MDFADRNAVLVSIKNLSIRMVRFYIFITEYFLFNIGHLIECHSTPALLNYATHAILKLYKRSTRFIK